MYHYYNSSGKEQIYQRIRLIGGFYSYNPMQSQYPTMFVTDKVKIYKARQRRLRKMIASDGSSDQSEVQYQNQQSFGTQGFLNSISSVSSSSLDSMFKSVQNNISFQSETHNIYQDNAHIFQISSVKNITSPQQQSVSYLICDFKEVDVEKTLADYQLISKNQNLNKKQYNTLSLTSISAKKPIYQSIIINQNKNLQSLPNSTKYSHLLSQRTPAFNKKSRIQKQSNIINYQDQILEERRILTSRQKIYLNLNLKKDKKQTHQQEMQIRYETRKKIREKANELLMRVRSQNYIGRHDYLKY